MTGKTGYRSVKWLTVVASVFFIWLFESIRHNYLEKILHDHEVYTLSIAVLVIGGYFFAHFVFAILERINAELTQERERLKALYEIGLGVASRLDPDHHLEVMVGEVRRLLNCDASLFLVTDEERSEARKKAWSGDLAGLAAVESMRLNQGIVAEAVTAGQAVKYEEEPGMQARGRGQLSECPILAAGFKSVAAVPVQVRGYLFGVMVAAARSAHRFTRNDLMLLSSVANLAADALENARLYKRVQEMAMVEERERIGREMHDGLAQTIGYLNLKTRSLEQLLAERRVEEARVELAQTRDAIKEAYADVRETIFNLRTSRIVPGSDFLSSLRRYVEEFNQYNLMSVELVVTGDTSPALPATTEVHLIRIIQEALSNVRKHAGTTRARVEFCREPELVRVVIADQGHGFDPADVAQDGRHFGLSIMKERARLIGARLEIDAERGRGTRIAISIQPIQPGNEGGDERWIPSRSSS